VEPIEQAEAAAEADTPEPAEVDEQAEGAGEAPSAVLAPGQPERTTGRYALTPGTLAVWFAVVVGLVGFILLGRVPIYPRLIVYPYGVVERHMRVADVWTRAAGDLPGHAVLVKILYFLALGIVLLGSFAALLLTMAAREEPAATGAPVAVADGEAGPVAAADGQAG
jgi:hypothetical protein